MKIPQTKCTIKFYYAVEKQQGFKMAITFAILKNEDGSTWRLPNVYSCNLETEAFNKAESRKEVILKNILTLNKFFNANNYSHIYEGEGYKYVLDYLLHLLNVSFKKKKSSHSNTRTPNVWWFDFSHNKKRRQELNKRQIAYKQFKEMPSLSDYKKLNVVVEKPLNIVSNPIENINENPYKEEILFKIFKMEEELKMLKELVNNGQDT
ncbi:MAG: hypothetical protein MJZ34_10650 [Paludibacteraceae bacterium]|nr:hypothetical protein [Paludibacteraceae bacterium]